MDNIPGVILQIFQNGKLIFKDSKGSLSFNGEERIYPNTFFHIASTGKIFTTLAALKLYEKGLLSLDEPIGAYVNSDVISGLLVIDDRDYSSQITFVIYLCIEVVGQIPMTL